MAGDFTLEPRHTGVVGMTGSGKTTFVIRYVLNTGAPESGDAPPAAVFIFDDQNRVWPRLKIPVCYTAAQLEAALAMRWICFNPERMFPLVNFQPARGIPTPVHAAFRFWCRWIGEVAARGPGRKIVCIPEVWRFCTEDSLPPELALLAQAGREFGVELVLDTQRPETLNPSLTGQFTELVCFKLASKEALNAVRSMGADRDLVEALPLGQFVAYNRLTGQQLRARVF
jgi:hypothetical protein